jgi:hypothetical protein
MFSGCPLTAVISISAITPAPLNSGGSQPARRRLARQAIGLPLCVRARAPTLDSIIILSLFISLRDSS